MSNSLKNQQNILQKLSIEKLNPMQEEAQAVIRSCSEIVLLSPTGTGKTLAFLLPIIAELDAEYTEIQALIVVPSRELAIQIEQVIREMGTGYKANAVYGGRSGSKDKIELKHPPAILIGTPGRVADHIRRENFSLENIKILVLDEFDKSLEVGFEAEMSEITSALPHIQKKILTSATNKVVIPDFVALKDPTYINYLEEGVPHLKIKTILSPTKNKLETLAKTLYQLRNQQGIIFCNFKDSIQEVSDFLIDKNINHGCFHGGMEQKDRERALIKFRNGTYQLIVTTDLAARGIDVPEINFIIHYQLPPRNHEFIHRNGRTARMHSEGTAYILHWEKEYLPVYVPETASYRAEEIDDEFTPAATIWETLFISGGRKDKISKGDISGLFIKQGNIEKHHIGIIELKQDCAFVAVQASQVDKLIQKIDNSRLKKKKIRVNII
ncbi:MAG TPA: helicase [Bacteroidales bacterium]|nr:helicase [Bacteroidales bacterium]